MTKTNSIRLSSCLLLVATWGCAAEAPPPPAPVQKETPAAEVIRISSTWNTSYPEQRILSPPSPISMFRTQHASQLVLGEKTAHEELVIDEEVELRAGGRISCRTTFSHELTVHWGRKGGEPAVELIRPDLNGTRSCSGGSHPEPTLVEGAHRALLVLRSDQLVVVEPSTDKRQYLPALE